MAVIVCLHVSHCLKALVLIVRVINVLDHSKHQGVIIILSHYNDVSLPIGTSFVSDRANSMYVIILVRCKVTHAVNLHSSMGSLG